MKSGLEAHGDAALLNDLRQPAWRSASWAGRLEGRIGRGLAELLFLEPHWRALAARAVPPRFIHAFEWHMAYLQHLANDAHAIHYVSLFAHGQTVAIFPLRHVRRSVGGIQLALWELPTHPHLILCEPLLAPECSGSGLFQQVAAILGRQTKLPWDALHLPNLPDDSPALWSLRAGPPVGTHLERTGQSMYFRCTDPATALARCSGQFKRNLRRQGRLLARRGAVSLSFARAGSELDAAFEDFLRLEASGWKGAAGRATAISLHPHLRGFYGELKTRFAAADACLIALLKVDGVAIAAQFCLLAGHTLSIQKIAYDETWHAEAPGSQLLLKTIEYCCAEPGIRHLSLVTAPEWAVGRWNPEIQEVWEAYVFRASLRGFGGLAMRRLKNCFSAESGILPAAGAGIGVGIGAGIANSIADQPPPAHPPESGVVESLAGPLAAFLLPP
ncbi:GNAT family N-acetyltransferase [Dechloromonas sp. XY25]|uniref:GNAT family N-acetyltransferase n=1 Tax=Dechloromonas hankyongensis TaxID=2908002 RepID=A0ABS9K6B0_9RHOO|nr:GNAT family N-acetyltransferase [Dechloromonas hankyongensis]MCG2578681.1 GNAT family N-acetyltransferase [Dechloromonas hankyongensis]